MNPGQNPLLQLERAADRVALTPDTHPAETRADVLLDAGLACGPVKHFFGPLVQALARQLGGKRGLAVNLGADPEHDLP